MEPEPRPTGIGGSIGFGASREGARRVSLSGMAETREHRGRGATAKSPLEDRGPTWRERWRAMRNVPPFLRMVWGTHRGFVAGIVVLRLIRAFGPVATLWVGS